jgi:competence protein ComEC
VDTRTLRRLILGFALLWLLIACSSLVLGRSSGELRVTFLDVGQGDGVVIETPSGKTLVIDTGNLDADGADDMGRRVIAPYLRQRGINRIGVLFLTHPDTDHIGGAATLLEQFPTDLLIDNGQFTRSDSPVAARVLQTASARRVPLRSARRGQELTTGDGVTIRVLAPTSAALFGPENDASIVLRIEYGQTVFLLTGDAGTTAETELLTSHQPLICDVLKAGHHGSRTSSIPAFLDAAHPRVAVFSAGRRNAHGHPAREVLERFAARNVKIYRTDQHGAITCRTDGITLRVETMLPGK